MSSPVLTTQSICQARGARDIPAILRTLDPQVQWEVWNDSSAQRVGTPHLRARHGPDDVVGFFQVLGTMQIHQFKVSSLVGDEHQVAGEIEFSVPSTGRRTRDEQLHPWSLGPQGQLTRFGHHTDTAKHAWIDGLNAHESPKSARTS